MHTKAARKQHFGDRAAQERERQRQLAADAAQLHRLDWLKRGQVMQKFAYSTEKVQSRYVRLSHDSATLNWGSSMVRVRNHSSPFFSA